MNNSGRRPSTCTFILKSDYQISWDENLGAAVVVLSSIPDSSLKTDGRLFNSWNLDLQNNSSRKYSQNVRTIITYAQVLHSVYGAAFHLLQILLTIS